MTTELLISVIVASLPQSILLRSHSQYCFALTVRFGLLSRFPSLTNDESCTHHAMTNSLNSLMPSCTAPIVPMTNSLIRWRFNQSPPNSWFIYGHLPSCFIAGQGFNANQTLGLTTFFPSQKSSLYLWLDTPITLPISCSIDQNCTRSDIFLCSHLERPRPEAT